MNKYVLKNSLDEVINTTNQHTLTLAIEYFSKVKKLSKVNLFKIYKIEKV